LHPSFAVIFLGLSLQKNTLGKGAVAPPKTIPTPTLNPYFTSDGYYSPRS